MTTIRLLVFAVAVIVATPTLAQVSIPARVVDYDSFMQQDVQSRIRVFNQITPENRAELVRTQLKRWVEKNRSRLTVEQLTVLDEFLAFAVADHYRQPAKEEDRAKAKALETRAAGLMSPADMGEALTIRGTYIPQQR
jgi:hypothetical protein